MIRAYFSHLARETFHASMEPARSQARALERVRAAIGDSRLARQTGLVHVRRPEDMRRLEATTPESMAATFTEALERGRSASGIFGRSPIVCFKRTSGTGAEPKHIPVNRDYLSSYRRSVLRMAASYCFTTGHWEDVGWRKLLLLAAHPEVDQVADGTPIGYSTGVLASRRPWLARFLSLPGREALSAPSLDERLDLSIRAAWNADLRMIAGMPRLVLKLAANMELTHGIRTLRERWPRLRAISHGGVALSDALREAIIARVGGANPPLFIEGYGASEGFLGHSWDPRERGLLFDAQETFFQFREQPGTGAFLQLHELERGRRYLVFLTTPGGLINYALGDWIEVLSTRPLLFRVAGRESEELSLVGERLTGAQVALALEELRTSGSATIGEEYVLWGAEEPRRLCFGIAVDGLAAIEPISHAAGLAEALDHALACANPTYRSMRRSEGTFGPPVVYGVPRRIFASYQERNLGRGQFKGRRLFKDWPDFKREYLDHAAS
jgi:hypothetical protein